MTIELRLGELYQRAKNIQRREGWGPLVLRGAAFVQGLFFRYGRYYVYEKEVDLTALARPTDDFELKIVSNLEEWRNLTAQGYEAGVPSVVSRLEKGAIGFCLFHKRKFASVTWVAPVPEAKREIDYVPFSVDFAAGEVCTGGSFTCPPYRGRGLLHQTYGYLLPYVAGKGVRKCKFSISIYNRSSLTAHAKFSPKMVGRGRYLKVLGWEYWRETREAER